MFRAGSPQSGGCRHQEGVLRGRPRDARGEEGDNAAYTAYTEYKDTGGDTFRVWLSEFVVTADSGAGLLLGGVRLTSPAP